MLKHPLRPWLCRLLLVVLFVPAAAARADDWPQWRGLHRDGVWSETGIIEKFPAAQLKLKWRSPLGPGYSGPTVAQGRAYVTDRAVEPKQTESVHCFDARSGKEIWSHSYDCPYRLSYEAGPRAAVSIDSGRAYALGAMGNLHCYEAAKGTVLWEKDLLNEYKIRMPIWGIAAAPLIDGNLLIIEVGGENACLVAFDKVTGAEKWKALDDRAGYSAPIIIEQAGRRVLVCWTGDNIAALDPATGEVLWKIPFTPSKMVLNVPTPVVHDDRLFVAAFYDGCADGPARSRQARRRNHLAEARPQRAEDRGDSTDHRHSVFRRPMRLRRR